MDKNTSETLREHFQMEEKALKQRWCVFCQSLCRYGWRALVLVFVVYIFQEMQGIFLLPNQLAACKKAFGMKLITYWNQLEKVGSDVEPSETHGIMLAIRFYCFFNMLVRLGLGKM